MSGVNYGNSSVHKSDLRLLENYVVLKRDIECQTLTADVIQGTGGGPLICDSDLNVGGSVSVNALTSASYTISGSNQFVITGPAGILSNTSGSVSGQHLQVRINGANYKIELKNV